MGTKGRPVGIVGGERERPVDRMRQNEPDSAERKAPGPGDWIVIVTGRGRIGGWSSLRLWGNFPIGHHTGITLSCGW
jgi:hypothetical protein